MQRTKPYAARDTRAAPYHRGNPDAPGSWKHDLHPAGKSNQAGGSLSNRLSDPGQSGGRGGSRPPGLLARLSNGPGSQKGQELLGGPTTPSGPKQLHGYGAAPPPSIHNVNSGFELLPPTNARGADGGVQDPSFDLRQPGQGAGAARPFGRSVFTSGIVAAGLGEQAEKERQRKRELGEIKERERLARNQAEMRAQQTVNILGQGKIWVRVENLASGTTADDVMSAFAPSPITSARPSPTPNSNPDLVSIDLEYTDRAAAEELVSTYNGVVADGNALKVGIVPVLAGRMGIAGAASNSRKLGARLGGGSGVQNGGSAQVNGGGKELLGDDSPGKMYSDSILRTDTRAVVQTLAEPAVTTAQRQDAWARGGGQPLSQRVGWGGGGGHGNGGRGGMQGW